MVTTYPILGLRYTENNKYEVVTYNEGYSQKKKKEKVKNKEDI